MTATKSAHIFTLPGWQGSGAQHWQRRWAEAFGDKVVEQHDWMHPLRGDWITRLEDVVQNQLKIQPSVKIAFVAHSLGCHLVASWAALSPNVSKVAGALLVAPPDAARADFPPQMHSWNKPILNRLPFPATMVVSINDPFSSLAASQQLAHNWGAELVNIGERGHINAESDLADWPAGRELFMTTLQASRRSG